MGDAADDAAAEAFVRRKLEAASSDAKRAKVAEPQRGWMIAGHFFPEREVLCPVCGRYMPMVPGGYAGMPYYSCPEDDITVGCGRDGEAIGKPASRVVRNHRSMAHHVFDRLWQSEGWSRKTAYAWIAAKMNLSAEDAHIARFSMSQCDALIEATQAEMATRRLREPAEQEE